MHLGAFSISLAVKDLAVSKAFYEKLGFSECGGDADRGWLILKSGDTVIGLFQNMFERNMLTFNPGWDQAAQATHPFDDVRTIQARLEEAGLSLDVKADPDTAGPAQIMLTDPDGNPVLIDQHR